MSYSYHEDKREIAQNLWSILDKGDLFFGMPGIDDRLIPQKGLSGGEAIVYAICKAIVEPSEHRMPPLDDIASLPGEIRVEVIGALTDLLGNEL